MCHTIRHKIGLKRAIGIFWLLGHGMPAFFNDFIPGVLINTPGQVSYPGIHSQELIKNYKI